MGSIAAVYRLLNDSRRRQLGVLAVLISIAGFLEVFGVGILFPYVAILQDPAKISDTNYLGILYRWSNAGSEETFLIAMSVGLLAVFCFKAAFLVLLANYQLRFVNDLQTQIGRRLLAHYVDGPYEFFLLSNTSTLVGNLTTSVSQLCGGVIQSALMLVAELVSLVGLVAFLVWLDPLFSLIALVFTSVMAVAFLGLIRGRITFYAKEYDSRWKAMIRKVNEALSAAKEIQVLGRGQYFVESYGREARAYALAGRRYSILSQLPRVVLETSAVAMLAAFAVFAIISNRTTADLFAVLAVFAAATVRIIPSINRVIQGWNSITFFKPAVSIVASAIAGKPEEEEERKKKAKEPEIAPISLRQGLELSVRSFAHRNSMHFQLRGIEIKVQRGEKIAIVGHSGSGKSTLLDLMLGLFPAFDGRLVVDGVDCRGREMAWQRSIGYVPQSVVMTDDTIKRNVAFGIEDAAIDLASVTRAISLAGLDRVVEVQQSGLETVIGDRGIRLSGGERQRIGIARALYHDPDLLILDEATSALDNQTERQIVDSILALSPAKTVIIIAHRLSSVRLCDRVYLMNAGRIVDVGTFDDIAVRHPDFVDPRSIASNGTAPKVTMDNRPCL